MQDSAHFQRLVEDAVQQAFDRARGDLTMRVMQAVAPAFEPRDNVQRLAAAVRAIETAYGQTEILGALLHGCAGFATRCALFVVRGVSAPVWQSSGFDANVVRGLTAQVGSGLGATAMQSMARAEGDPTEFDAHFVSLVGAPADHKCVVFPLMVREKVAALLYVDGGVEGVCDADALEILTLASGNRIEIAASRKPPVHTMAAAAGAAHPPAPVAATHAAAIPSHSAPVLVPAPAPATPMASAAPAMAPAVHEPAAPVHVVQPAEHDHQAASHPAPASQPGPGDEVHAKARRFAKLLVDEIKLYNQDAVNAGKEHGDLYNRLREPIDKSREAYEKRYGSTAAATGNYFANELVRILADNNIALMGANFPR
jgi:hypothetical protein